MPVLDAAATPDGGWERAAGGVGGCRPARLTERAPGDAAAEAAPAADADREAGHYRLPTTPVRKPTTTTAPMTPTPRKKPFFNSADHPLMAIPPRLVAWPVPISPAIPGAGPRRG